MPVIWLDGEHNGESPMWLSGWGDSPRHSSPAGNYERACKSNFKVSHTILNVSAYFSEMLKIRSEIRTYRKMDRETDGRIYNMAKLIKAFLEF